MKLVGRGEPAARGAGVGAAVVADQVSKVFESRHSRTEAVCDVSFQVDGGRFVSLIGPSGCGKTTMAKMVGDLTQPTSGSITVGGRAPATLRRERKVGIVFQAPTLVEWRTLLRNVALPLEIARVPRAERHESARRLLELVGLNGFEDHYPDQVSGGMKQRAAIARALSFDPSVLIMDEPFGALDMITRDRMAFELLDIWSSSRKTILFITHSIEEAVLLSDEVIAFTERPARINEIVEIDLPRPRVVAHRESSEFVAAAAHLRRLLEP